MSDSMDTLIVEPGKAPRPAVISVTLVMRSGKGALKLTEQMLKKAINEACNRQIGQELEENVIQQVMATGEAALPDKYMNIVRECLRDL